MHKRFKYAACIVLASVLSAAPYANTPVAGAGSTAAAALYANWAGDWAKKSRLTLDYAGVGSSGGLKAIAEGKVDFGASDVAPPPAQLERDGLICFPTAISGIVPLINLPGLPRGGLKLTGAVLADILSGRLTRWNAAPIAALNRDLHLPDLPIKLIAREDGSGTTYVLSHYLSKVSLGWQSGPGVGFKLKWPAEAQLIKGTAAMLDTVAKTPGAIGYAEFGPADKAGLNYARLANRRGEYPQPGADSFRAALTGSGWTNAGNFEEMLTDMAEKDAWPITGGTFVVMRKKVADAARAGNALSLFSYGFMHGDKLAAGLGWIPLPELTQARAIGEMNKIRAADGRALSWRINY